MFSLLHQVQRQVRFQNPVDDERKQIFQSLQERDCLEIV